MAAVELNVARRPVAAVAVDKVESVELEPPAQRQRPPPRYQARAAECAAECAVEGLVDAVQLTAVERP